ncbi:MAG: hypothetical protein QM773_13410 [Hyphomonadaceae bacterium]
METDPKILKDDFMLRGDLYVDAIKNFKLEKEMAPVLGKISDTGPGLEAGAKLCTRDITLDG